MTEKIYTLKELEGSLNEQQKRFCEARLFNNKVQSYKIAYPDCGYKSASTSATRLLEDVRILQYIEFLKKDIEGITGVSKIKNVAELAKIAYSSIAHLHESWIKLSDYNKLTTDQLSAIESTESKTITTNFDDTTKEIEYIKLKLHPKITAIQEINKMMGYHETQKIEHSGEIKSTIAELFK